MPPQIVPVPVPVAAFAARPDPFRLRLFVDYPSEQLSEVVVDEEQPGEITVSVFYRNLIEVTEGVHDGLPGWLITDAIEVELRRELGDRAVADGSTGTAVPPLGRARRNENRRLGLDAADSGLCPLWVRKP